MGKLLFLAFCLLSARAAPAQIPAQNLDSPDAPTPTQSIAIAAGVPLHIRVTRTAKIHLGAPVEGVLTESIYVSDRLVLPKGAAVRGTVSAYAPVARKVRAQALLNGDVTPLHDPVVDFNDLHLEGAGGEVHLHSNAHIRNTRIVRFKASSKKPSVRERVTAAVRQRVKSTYDEIFGPNKKDHALKLLYSQLPYHPQRIWAGTQFIADLETPVFVDLPGQPPAPRAPAPSLDGINVSARLAETVDSAGAKKGDEVTAIVTQPVFDAGHNLILAEGAELEGSITQSKSARSFGRNGSLRFAFRGVKSEGQPVQRAYGTLTGAEGDAGQNLKVNQEGEVSANPDGNRFVAPLLLALTARAGRDHHHHDDGDGNIGGETVASNGFGLVARVIALTAANANVATGFGVYALGKSIYFRFLSRGNQVSFLKDTQVEVKLSSRESPVTHSP